MAAAAAGARTLRSSHSHFDLAVIGADDPLGEAVLKLFDESELPIGRLLPLSLDDESEGVVTYRGEEWPCMPARGFDYSQAQAVIVPSASPAARALVAELRARHPVLPVLDLPRITPAPVLALRILARVLRAVGGDCTLDAFVSLPVALAGKAGVDELSRQTRELFNLESPEPEVFPLQIAFNVLPVLASGATRYAAPTLRDAWRVGGGDLDARFSCQWSPLFFGATLIVHARFAGAVSAQALREALRRQADVLLMESDLPAGHPTPATDAAESDALFVGQLNVDGNSVQCVAVFDPVRLEAREFEVSVENWIEKPADSVLT